MFSNWKYAAIILAIATATGSALLQYDDATNHPWVTIALTAIAVVTALFAPVPNLGKKNNGGGTDASSS